ncbi:MAG TPA: toll/interleukin-1 receptor domain-containing protein [Chthoniobacterales bacterium]|nr:toll/interleukin-1 receptor domain-containing protein [Chthoniobacterales bacterium]
MTPKTRDVFISYSQEDKVTADTICAALESAGIRCWIAPRDVQPGRSFAGEITRAMEASKIMVLVFSAHSNQSEQVLREVQLAVDSHLHILQFRIADVPASDDLKYYLGTPHWLDALTRPLKSHIERLAISVRALLDVEKASAPANLPTSPIETKQPTPASVSPPLPVVVGANTKWFGPLIAIVILGALVLFAGGIWLVAHGIGYIRQQRSTIAQTTPAPAPPASPSVAATGAAGDNSNVKEADTYMQRARERFKRQDYDGALADLDRSLELNPKNSDAFNDRGLVKKYKNDSVGAAADYNKALDLNPKNASALNNLGVLKLDRGETEAAIIYFDRVLGIDPARVMTFVLRGDAKSMQGELKHAIADYDRALQLDPRNLSAIQFRAFAEMRSGQWSSAVADLQMRCTLAPAIQDYFRLLLWVAQSHLPDIAEANRELAEYVNTRNPPKGPDWNGQIAGFLLDKIPTEKFLDFNSGFLKNDARRHMQAAMFAGMKRLSEVNKVGAISQFQDCLAQNQNKAFEDRLVRSQLKSLGK